MFLYSKKKRWGKRGKNSKYVGGKGARAVNRKPQIQAPGIRLELQQKKRTNGNEFLGSQ